MKYHLYEVFSVDMFHCFSLYYYSIFFSFPGVATYCKNSATPVKAEEGLHSTLTTKTDNIIGCYGDVTDFTAEELEALDAEGRTVITQHRIRSILI